MTKRAFVQASALGATLGLVPATSHAKAAPRRHRNEPRRRELSPFWQFREAGSGDWLPATVPGIVHTDLLANGKIPDPFFRTNERDLQWIDKKDWEYRTILDIDADTLAYDHLELCFAGLDTYADVFLNDALVFSADNMFRRWTADIKAHARAGQNDLRVLLRSPIHEGLKKLASLGFDLPAVVDWSEIGGLGDKKIGMFTRKAGYHYGWDWGPRFVTSGIWRNVELRAWNGARISDLHIVQNSLSPDMADLTAVFEIVSDVSGPAVVELDESQERATTRHVRTQIKPGFNRVEVRFAVARPRLWWTNGLGEPYLYEFTGRLVTARAIDQRAIRIGLRTLRIVQNRDADGASFYVELNGVPVFMKGADYIPNDSFLPRVSRAVYQRVVRSAVDTHMNMLRVWGGGIYEDDAFYDLCDENGILVWQDFMFACVMYPGEAEFLDNVREEAIDNVRRLRNHPCIALWVGNNEIDTAWQNDVPNGGWGWKQKYSPDQRAQMWDAYQAIFYRILPAVVAQHDPQRFYWPSSPLAAWDGQSEVRHADVTAKEQSGDLHYWGVWWGQKPFSVYRERIGRFMSEYGFQSFPEFRTIQAYAVPGDYDILSEVMQAHQRSAIGNATIATYMARDYKVPKDFRQFLYVGQVLQAEGVRIAMEAHRARRPYCMGSLFWQINDCWPVASWSSIDYFGRWKALQYFARKSFAPVLVTSNLDGNAVTIRVINDRLQSSAAILTLSVMDFRGNLVRSTQQDLTLRANSSEIAFTALASDLLAGYPPETVLLHASLAIGGEPPAEDVLYFSPVKDLALPSTSIAVTVKETGSGYAIALSSPTLAKNVYLGLDQVDGTFDDNYFDLLPNTIKFVQFMPSRATTVRAIETGLSLMHMAMVA